uniref:Protein kinase domain-containing protein n=1 Tax=Rhabditophanes sp. KR3021 TaxID=114890 RepID=A0AC35TXF6_9BILA
MSNRLVRDFSSPSTPSLPPPPQLPTVEEMAVTKYEDLPKMTTPSLLTQYYRPDKFSTPHQHPNLTKSPSPTATTVLGVSSVVAAMKVAFNDTPPTYHLEDECPLLLNIPITEADPGFHRLRPLFDVTSLYGHPDKVICMDSIFSDKKVAAEYRSKIIEYQFAKRTACLVENLMEMKLHTQAMYRDNHSFYRPIINANKKWFALKSEFGKSPHQVDDMLKREGGILMVKNEITSITPQFWGASIVDGFKGLFLSVNRGGSLWDSIPYYNGIKSESAIKQICFQLAGGLEFLHCDALASHLFRRGNHFRQKLGLSHNTVNPRNIFFLHQICKCGRPDDFDNKECPICRHRNILFSVIKITDYTDIDCANRVVKIRECQKPYYAPEIIRFGVSVRNSDIYSLGMILGLLYTGNEQLGNSEKIANCPINQIEINRHSLPPYTTSNMIDIYLRCIAVNPNSRLTYTTLKNELLSLCSGRGGMYLSMKTLLNSYMKDVHGRGRSKSAHNNIPSYLSRSSSYLSYCGDSRKFERASSTQTEPIQTDDQRASLLS